MSPRRIWIAAAAATGCLLVAGALFVRRRAEAVARELVDPPFYKPQPLARVEATFRELAAGSAGDPGGTWETARVDGLELWRLRRRGPFRGLVLMLHGFGDDRWGTSPALRAFPHLDAAIFTYRARDEALRAGRPAPPVTFGARESEEVVAMVHHLERQGVPRGRILLLGRSLGASVGLLALARLEAEGAGPLGGIIWEGAPAGSRDFAERLVQGPRDRPWHVLAPLIGRIAADRAGRLGAYRPDETELTARVQAGLRTPALCFLATQDRLAPAPVQREIAQRFVTCRLVEVPTWHLNCMAVLGPAYDREMRASAATWLR